MSEQMCVVLALTKMTEHCFTRLALSSHFSVWGGFVRQALTGLVPSDCVTHIGQPGCQLPGQHLAERSMSMAVASIEEFALNDKHLTSYSKFWVR